MDFTTNEFREAVKSAIEKATYEEWGNCPICSEEFSYTEFNPDKAADNVIELLNALIVIEVRNKRNLNILNNILDEDECDATEIDIY